MPSWLNVLLITVLTLVMVGGISFAVHTGNTLVGHLIGASCLGVGMGFSYLNGLHTDLEVEEFIKKHKRKK